MGEILATLFLLIMIKSIIGAFLKRQLIIQIRNYRKACVISGKEVEVGFEDLGTLLKYTFSLKIGKNGLLPEEKLEKVAEYK